MHKELVMPVIWVCLGVIGKMIGDPKHRGTLGFALGFFLGPLGLIIVRVLPAKQLPAVCDSRAWATGREPLRPSPPAHHPNRVWQTLGMVAAGIVLVGMVVGLVMAAPPAAGDQQVAAAPGTVEPPDDIPGLTSPPIASVASGSSAARLEVDDIDARDKKAGRVWIKGCFDKNGRYVAGHYKK